MIPNQWYPILESRDLRPGKPVGATRLGKDLVLWRSESGSIACLRDRCSHRAARLNTGRVPDGCIECPFHGLRFDEKGRCVRIPAYGRDASIPTGFDVASYPVRESHGLVWYWHGEAKPDEGELPWLAGTRPESAFASAAQILPVNYLRMMELGADQHHLPFVHRRLYPRTGARVDEYEAQAEGPLISVRGTLRRDGEDPRTSAGSPFAMRIRMPSLLAFELGRLEVIASATPIDAQRTWLWVRAHQAYLPAALGGRLLARLILPVQRFIFNAQDLPALRSQQLDDPGDISGYHLFEADRGIALFFSMRHRLLREAASRSADAA